MQISISRLWFSKMTLSIANWFRIRHIQFKIYWHCELHSIHTCSTNIWEFWKICIWIRFSLKSALKITLQWKSKEKKNEFNTLFAICKHTTYLIWWTFHTPMYGIHTIVMMRVRLHHQQKWIEQNRSWERERKKSEKNRRREGRNSNSSSRIRLRIWHESQQRDVYRQKLI